MSDPPPLPPVEEGALDDAGLDALLADIAALTTEVEVRCKRVGAHSAPADAAGAVAALRAWTVSAVQLAYRYQGRRWIDTILRDGPGWRVVRSSPG